MYQLTCDPHNAVQLFPNNTIADIDIDDSEISNENQPEENIVNTALSPPSDSAQQDAEDNEEQVPGNNSCVPTVPATTCSAYQILKTERNRRSLGIAYKGCKKKGNDITRNVQKSARNVKERCLHKSLEQKSQRSFLCGQFTDKDRQKIFKQFWQYSWKEKRMFVKGLVATRKIIRRRKIENKQKEKNEGHDIPMPKADGTKECVVSSLLKLCI